MQATLQRRGYRVTVGPTFANIFVSFHEQIWLANCPLIFKTRMYRRYIDDYFALFDEKTQDQKFLQYLYKKHPNIKFIIKYESDK